MTRKLYYFAHPYTAKDAAGNYVPAAEEANFLICAMRSAELLKRGFNIYSPICHTHPVHRACVEFLTRHEHELWYELDEEFIARCDFDGIILAPGWETSKGCRHEQEIFKQRGLSVLFYEDVIRIMEVEK